jgi:membrane peptidoglycan carboxypeptidase
MKYILTIGILVAVFCATVELYTVFNLPPAQEIKKLVTGAPRYIPTYTDRNGLPMPSRYTLAGQSSYTPLDSIPKHLIDYCVYFEDRSFWSWHNVGVSFRGLMRATFARDGSGGSSITMQLIKNASGYNETKGIAGYWRKWLEIHQAIALNGVMTKREILEAYFNTVPFGSGSRVGIGAASEFYFSCRPSELRPAQGLFLLALLPLSVTDARTDLDRIYTRYRARAQRLLDDGFITQDDPYLDEILMGPTLKVHRTLPSSTGIYLDRVADEVRRRVGGLRYDPEFDGLRVETTIDMEAQDAVTAILAEETAKFPGSYASFIMMNQHNEVVIYASSYPTLTRYLDIILSDKILPSSRMKTFSYSCVMEALVARGFSNKQILEFMLPTVYKVSEKHVVSDLDGRPVHLRVAFARSLNSCAYFASNEVVKPADVVSFMRRFGGEFIPYPSISMGTQPWSELKLCLTYNTILNREGFVSEPVFVRRILSRTGDVTIYDVDQTPTIRQDQVVSARVSSLIKEALREATSKGTSKYLMELEELAALDLGFKTGTGEGRIRGARGKNTNTQLGVTGFVGDYTCSLLLHGKAFDRVSGDVSVPVLGRILATLKRMEKL